MATLQEQYNLIKEGKGDKNQFLKHARYIFPEYVNTYNNFDQTVNILKGKNILSEHNMGLGMVSNMGKNKGINDWISIFQESIKARSEETRLNSSHLV